MSNDRTLKGLVHGGCETWFSSTYSGSRYQPRCRTHLETVTCVLSSDPPPSAAPASPPRRAPRAGAAPQARPCEPHIAYCDPRATVHRMLNWARAPQRQTWRARRAARPRPHCPLPDAEAERVYLPEHIRVGRCAAPSATRDSLLMVPCSRNGTTATGRRKPVEHNGRALRERSARRRAGWRTAQRGCYDSGAAGCVHKALH